MRAALSSSTALAVLALTATFLSAPVAQAADKPAEAPARVIEVSGPDLRSAAIGLFLKGQRDEAIAFLGGLPPSQEAQLVKAELLVRMDRGAEALDALAPVEFEPKTAPEQWTRMVALRACAAHQAGLTLDRDEWLMRLAARAPHSTGRVNALACAGREADAARVLAAGVDEAGARGASPQLLSAAVYENPTAFDRRQAACLERVHASVIHTAAESVALMDRHGARKN